MKKMVVVSAYMLICLTLLSGCTADKDDTEQSLVPDQSDDMIFSVTMPDQDEVPFVGFVTDDPSGEIAYDFKDPENADGIVIAPKE